MITDDEFRTKLETRLNERLSLTDLQREKIWEVVADIRGLEREEISYENCFTATKDVYVYEL